VEEKKKRKRGPRGNVRRGGEVSYYPHTAWRGQGFAPRHRISLRFVINKQQSNAGVLYYNSRIIPTYLYDIDPAFASSAMPFFTELAGIYKRYRLVKCTTEFHFACRETFPLVVYLVPNNTDPGNNVITNVQQLYSQPKTQITVVGGAAGNNVGYLKNEITVAEFAGSANANLDDAYSARMDGTGGGPAQALAMVFGFVATGADVPTATGGITFTLSSVLEFDCFELLNPTG